MLSRPVGALAAALAIVAAPALAAEAGTPPSTRQAVSDAIGLLCIPVLISAQLPTRGQVEQSGFQIIAETGSDGAERPAYERRSAEGDRVKVNTDDDAAFCIVTVYGRVEAIEDYRAALSEQRWRQTEPPKPLSPKRTMETWAVRISSTSTMIQVLAVDPTGATDSTDPVVLGALRIMP